MGIPTGKLVHVIEGGHRVILNENQPLSFLKLMRGQLMRQQRAGSTYYNDTNLLIEEDKNEPLQKTNG